MVTEYIYVEEDGVKLVFNLQSRTVETHAFMTEGDGRRLRALKTGLQMMLSSFIRQRKETE